MCVKEKNVTRAKIWSKLFTIIIEHRNSYLTFQGEIFFVRFYHTKEFLGIIRYLILSIAFGTFFNSAFKTNISHDEQTTLAESLPFYSKRISDDHIPTISKFESIERIKILLKERILNILHLELSEEGVNFTLMRLFF
ncbi:MAG: hypothetical protein J0M18_00300 [Ignavibacteria bacterium]|nr:hypothetical protein [Ignavibacteria bacterium]